MERGVALSAPPTELSILPLVLLVFFTLGLVSSTLTSFLKGSGVVNPKTYWHQSSWKSTNMIWILHILIGMVMVKLMSSYGCVLYTAIQECECAESAAAVLVLVVAVSVSTEAWEGIALKRQHWKVGRYLVCPPAFLELPTRLVRPSFCVALPRIYSLFMKGKFNAYLLWPLEKSIKINKRRACVYSKHKNTYSSLKVALLFPKVGRLSRRVAIKYSYNYDRIYRQSTLQYED